MGWRIFVKAQVTRDLEIDPSQAWAYSRVAQYAEDVVKKELGSDATIESMSILWEPDE